MPEEIDHNAVEADVREKASALADSLDAARIAGFSVVFPGNVPSLRSMQISSTGAVPAAPAVAEVEPAPAPAPAEPAARPAGRTTAAGTSTTGDTVKEAISGAVKGA